MDILNLTNRDKTSISQEELRKFLSFKPGFSNLVINITIISHGYGSWQQM